MSTGTELNHSFKNIRKHIRKGNVDTALECLERLQTFVNTRQGNINRAAYDATGGTVLPIEKRHFVSQTTTSKKTKLTFAPKTGRVEIKIGRNDLDNNATRDLIDQLMEVEVELGFTLRGTVGVNSEGTVYCNLSSGNHQNHLKLTSRV